MRIFLSGVLAASICAVAGCGGQDGPSSEASSECTATATASTSAWLSEATAPDSQTKYTRFIVQTDGRAVQSESLKASGDTRREYRVAGVTMEMQDLGENLQSVELKEGDQEAMLQELENMPGVVRIEPDFDVHTAEVTDEISEDAAPDQWAHIKVDSDDAWRISVGSSQVTVGVVDGGVDIDHPDLKENIYSNSREILNGKDDDGNGYVDDIHGWDFENNDNNPRSDSSSHFHGSHVSGIIGGVAHRARMQIGHAPHVRIIPLKFIGTDGTGKTSDAIRAINYAIKAKVNIISASWSSTHYSDALYSALSRARSAGILFVAASGNAKANTDRTPHYPAAYPLDNIISVAASTKTDALASYSDYGLKSVDVAAPGSSIYSLANNGRYATISGTSMATPLVSGVAVLIKAAHPSFTYKQLAQSIFMGVDKTSVFKSKVKYGGRVNAFKALNAADEVARGQGIELTELEPAPCAN